MVPVLQLGTCVRVSHEQSRGRACSDEQVSNVPLAVSRRCDNWRCFFGVAVIRVGACKEEQPHYLCVPRMCCLYEM